MKKKVSKERPFELNEDKIETSLILSDDKETKETLPTAGFQHEKIISQITLRKSFSLSRSQRSISHLIVIQLSFRDLPGTRRFSRYFLICAPPFFHLFNYQQVFRGVKTPSRRSNRWPAYGSLSYIYGGPAPVSN